MKVKVFWNDFPSKLETEINEWMAKYPCFVDVKFATQSQDIDNVIITLFYEEKNWH
jgi:hypothetical protein